MKTDPVRNPPPIGNIAKPEADAIVNNKLIIRLMAELTTLRKSLRALTNSMWLEAERKDMTWKTGCKLRWKSQPRNTSQPRLSD